MRCHLGDFGEYAALRRRIGEIERQSSKGNPTHAQRDRMQRELTSARKAMRAHPCHGCAERESHARWAERWWRLKTEHEQLSRQIRTRTGQVAKRFDRVTEVLESLGYLDRDASGALVSTSSGRILKRIYGERDLLVAECLRRGLWDGLDEAGIARLDLASPGREMLATAAGVLYVHYVDGIGRSKLTPKVIDRAVGAPTTARNWNTITKLRAACDGSASR